MDKTIGFLNKVTYLVMTHNFFRIVGNGIRTMNTQRAIDFELSVCLTTQDPPPTTRYKIKGAFLSLGITPTDERINAFMGDVVDEVLLDVPANSRIEIPHKLIVEWNYLKQY